MNKKNKHYLIVITGPTGVGKTQVSTDIASEYRAPVISADSRQFYKEMNIGTAVPAPEELEKARHYFIGSLSIHDYYNASMFEEESLNLIEKLFKKTNMVLMAGGSGLYINAVCRGIDDLPTVDSGLRKDLAEEYQLKGINWLRQQLKMRDPDHYEIVDLKNPNRMLKALEINLMTGKPYSSFLTREKKERNFNIVKIGLNIKRKYLYEKINSRVDQMIKQGLPEEAKRLYRFRHLNALNSVGYKELFDYIEGETSLERAIELIKRNSRRYAKRQLTWLAKDREIKWFHPDDLQGIKEFIEKLTGIKAKK